MSLADMSARRHLGRSVIVASGFAPWASFSFESVCMSTVEVLAV